jgi:hypothetical protein
MKTTSGPRKLRAAAGQEPALLIGFRAADITLALVQPQHPEIHEHISRGSGPWRKHRETVIKGWFMMELHCAYYLLTIQRYESVTISSMKDDQDVVKYFCISSIKDDQGFSSAIQP